MFCCGNCFSDRFLQKEVISVKSAQTGDCSYCGSKVVPVVEPHTLADTFQQVADLYTASGEDGAVTLVDLLKRDWRLFEGLEDIKCNALLEAIFPGEDLNTKKYLPRSAPDSKRIVHWDAFREELKHQNRYFPQQIPDLDHLKELLNFTILPEEDQPAAMFRARCNNEKRAYPKEEMGKPPEKVASSGRANPVGIPYLYTASDPDTAIAEIRPHKSDSVSVAQIKVLEKLNLLDLRDPRKTISPFSLDEDDLNQLYTDIEYLCRLGIELEKPILPREANLEYLPTQYLCEFIKHCGFDGVVYKSSVGKGVNYAVFNDDKIEIENVKLYEITDVDIKSEMLA